MKRIIWIAITNILMYSLQAQDYKISFSGTGASTNVSSVTVENLTKGTSLTIDGKDILRLRSVAVGISDLKQNMDENIRFYPNPMQDQTQMEFYLPKSGQTIIEVFDISGKKIACYENYMESGLNSFKLKELGKGLFIIQIKSNEISLKGKLLSQAYNLIKPEIEFLQSKAFEENAEVLKNGTAEVYMHYNNGDRLKFKGISGNHKTVVMDVPSSNKTINFEFSACIDTDGRGYEIVKIGNQWWMAENLAYLPEVHPISLGSRTANKKYFVYGYNSSDLAKAKIEDNYLTYGVLYNWWAAMNLAKGSSNNPSGIQGVCPVGWHLPSDSEWKQLELKIGIELNDVDGIGFRGDKSNILKSTYGWRFEKNGTNSTGFSGLPGGYVRHEGISSGIGYYAKWWTTTEKDPFSFNTYVWYREINCFDNTIMRENISKGDCFSVRCIRD